MDYELFEELKWQAINALETNNNPSEVIQSLANLISYVAEFYINNQNN